VAKEDPSEKVIATNRKAMFNYEIFERAEAGMLLAGSEVKSIREGGLNFRDSFVDFRGGEMWLVNCLIGPYSHGNIQNHAEGRERKLLLHKKEIHKLAVAVERQGMTMVPLELYFNARGRAKLRLALATGKKLHDKRADEAKRDWQRQKARLMRDKG